MLAGLTPAGVNQRRRQGMSAEAILATPSQNVRRSELLFGERITLSDLVRISGKPKETIRGRLVRGLSAERAAFGPTEDGERRPGDVMPTREGVRACAAR
jgi:hypothetical protein